MNAEGKALNNAAVAQNAECGWFQAGVVSGIVDSDGNIRLTYNRLKILACADR